MQYVQGGSGYVETQVVLGGKLDGFNGRLDSLVDKLDGFNGPLDCSCGKLENVFSCDQDEFM